MTISHDERTSSTPPTPVTLLRVFALLGVQSFGGGPALLFLIRRSVVERHRWMDDDEFMAFYAITQITPGVNLLALTVLVGRRLAGWRGATLALLGLLLPTTAIAIVLTAGYTTVRQFDLVQAAIDGIIPATAGITLLLAIATARPQLRASLREGWRSLLLSVLLVLASSVLVWLLNVPVIVVLLSAGALGALLQMRRPPAPPDEELPRP